MPPVECKKQDNQEGKDLVDHAVLVDYHSHSVVNSAGLLSILDRRIWDKTKRGSPVEFALGYEIVQENVYVHVVLSLATSMYSYIILERKIRHNELEKSNNQNGFVGRSNCSQNFREILAGDKEHDQHRKETVEGHQVYDH